MKWSDFRGTLYNSETGKDFKNLADQKWPQVGAWGLNWRKMPRFFKAINIIDRILVLNFRKQVKTQSQGSGVTQTYQILANETPSPVFNRQWTSEKKLLTIMLRKFRRVINVAICLIFSGIFYSTVPAFWLFGENFLL